VSISDFLASINGLTPDQVASIPAAQQAPLTLNAVGGGLDAFGQGLGAVSHIMFGIQARQAAQFQAAQLRQNADSAQASSQRSAIDVDRQTQMITSRALAVAAASGGGASDPTVVNLIARDAAQGAYLKSVALYQGDDRARLMSEQADAKDFEGKATERNSYEVGAAAFAGGATSLLKTHARGASLFSRFGGGGPNLTQSGSDWDNG
jgi:hypothetical protein